MAPSHPGQPAGRQQPRQMIASLFSSQENDRVLQTSVREPDLNGNDAVPQQSRILKLLRSNVIVSGLLLGI